MQSQLQPAPFRVPLLNARGELVETWRRFFLSTSALINAILASQALGVPHPAMIFEDGSDGESSWLMPGPPGLQGVVGNAGPPGLDGMDGLESDWMIPGTPGVAGAAGATGAQGIGVPGMDGADGEDAWSFWPLNPAALTAGSADTNLAVTIGTGATALLSPASVSVIWNGVLSGTRGGTGVNNGASLITIGGNLTLSGAFGTTITLTAATAVTLPTSGTLYGTLAASITSAQLLTSLTDPTGTGVAVFGTAPTFTTSILTPLIYGSASASANLVLQSTSNSTRGQIQTNDLMQVAVQNETFGATSPIYIDVGVGTTSTITTGAITGLRFAPTLQVKGNSAITIASLFNAAGIITDDGTARTLGPALYFVNQFTYTATVAGGLVLNDLAGIPTLLGFHHGPKFTVTGAGTGTAQTSCGLHISNQASVPTGWTITNYIGMLIDLPGTLTGTITNFYGVKNNGAAATGRWFLYETGGMQSSHKGNLRLGDNTAPTTLFDVAGKLTATSGGLITRYNNIATVAGGVPAIYGNGRSAAATAAVASVAAYTVSAADGSFWVSANVLVTASVTHSFTVTCTYTDEGGTSRTLTLNFSQITGTFVTTITNVTGVGAYEGVALHIRAKASTSITIATTGTFTSVTYNVEGYISQLG